MTQETKKYSASEFVQKLKNDDFGSATSPVFMGMVKSAEDDQHLMFANHMDCSNWVPIPLEIIESVEFMRLVPCKDHEHPLVRMTIQEPSTDEARMFASLAKSAARSMLPTIPRGIGTVSRIFRPRRSRRLFSDEPSHRHSPDCYYNCMNDIASLGFDDPEYAEFWYNFAQELCGQLCS